MRSQFEDFEHDKFDEVNAAGRPTEPIDSKSRSLDRGNVSEGDLVQSTAADAGALAPSNVRRTDEPRNGKGTLPKSNPVKDGRGTVRSDIYLSGSLATDNFELISAYLDGELSPTERNRVQAAIDCDPQIKSLYTRLLALQSQMQSLDAPPSQTSPAEIAERVFQSLDRRRQRRLWFTGSAIAASVIATITGIIPGITSADLRFARTLNLDKPTSDSVMLTVAVNKPAINIPKSIGGFEPAKPLPQEHQL